jgi:hypothetical protein
MEQETILKEILHALKLHSEEMDRKFDAMNSKMDERFNQMDKRFDRLEKKVDGNRVELTETQETTDFILSKTAQHEKKLRELSE